jgi:hypothetical protein
MVRAPAALADAPRAGRDDAGAPCPNSIRDRFRAPARPAQETALPARRTAHRGATRGLNLAAARTPRTRGGGPLLFGGHALSGALASRLGTGDIARSRAGAAVRRPNRSLDSMPLRAMRTPMCLPRHHLRRWGAS